MTPTDDLERRFLLVKRGLYYAPDNHGYTGIKERAGRYLESDASPDHGVTAIHEDEAPDYSPACFHDIAREHLQSKVDQAADEIARLRAENERLEFALAYLGSCTAATAEGLVGRKTTSRSELRRHRSICEKLLAACRGESLERGLSSSFIAGTEHRLQGAIDAIDARQALQEGPRHE